jgi:colicin import membrane protein
MMLVSDAWLEGLLDASLATQDVLLETWQANAQHGQRALQEMTAHLEYSVLDLLDQLSVERTARATAQASIERLERECDQARRERDEARRELAEAGRERDHARSEGDEARRRAEQAETASQRLERELARERERLATAEATATRNRAVEPIATRKPAAEATATRTPAAEPTATRQPAAEATATRENAAEAATVSVVRREDEFAVVRNGAGRASRVFDTMAEAVGHAREIAQAEHADLRLPAPELEATPRPKKPRARKR